MFSVGSGSIFAYGALDKGYRNDFTDQKAYDYGQRAIYHATFRGVHMKDDSYNIMSRDGLYGTPLQVCREKTGLNAWFENQMVQNQASYCSQKEIPFSYFDLW